MTITELVNKYGFMSLSDGAAYEGISLSREDFEQAARIQARIDFPSIEDYEAAYPVGQNFHTGKWGFDRWGDGLNLDNCRFPTRLYAEKARATNYAKLVA